MVFCSYLIRDALHEGIAYDVSCLELRYAGVFPPFSLPIGGLHLPMLPLVRNLIFSCFGTVTPCTHDQ